MLKAFGLAIVAGIAGYAAGAFGSYILIQNLSANTHDKALEAAMTSAFVTGPAMALLTAAGTFAFFAVRHTKRSAQRS